MVLLVEQLSGEPEVSKRDTKGTPLKINDMHPLVLQRP